MLLTATKISFPDRDKRFFFSLKLPDRGTTRGVMRPGREADHSPQIIGEIGRSGAIPLLLYVHGVHRIALPFTVTKVTI